MASRVCVCTVYVMNALYWQHYVIDAINTLRPQNMFSKPAPQPSYIWFLLPVGLSRCAWGKQGHRAVGGIGEPVAGDIGVVSDWREFKGVSRDDRLVPPTEAMCAASETFSRVAVRSASSLETSDRTHTYTRLIRYMHMLRNIISPIDTRECILKAEESAHPVS